MAISTDDLNVVLQQVKDLIVDFTAKTYAWSSGVAGGGPNADGKYPLPTGLGSYTLIACPSQQAADSQKIQMAGAGTISVGATAGFTAEGNNQYTFKASDAGKVFVMVSNAAGTADIRLLLPDNLPRGWSVVVVQAGNNRLRFRKVNDPDSTNSQLRGGKGYATATNGALAVAFVDSITSGNNNNIITIGGDTAP